MDYDEITGQLLWYGNGSSTAVYEVLCLTGGSFVIPVSYTLNAQGNLVIDYSNLIGAVPGDILTFTVKTICGANYSDTFFFYLYCSRC